MLITEAAVKRGEKTWTGRRHCDIISTMLREGEELPIIRAEQGFVTDYREFVDRRRAFVIAVCNRQLPVPPSGNVHDLTSDELW